MRMGRDSMLVMLSPRSAKTEQALNSSPGPSLREKTTEVLHMRVSEGDCGKCTPSDKAGKVQE